MIKKIFVFALFLFSTVCGYSQIKYAARTAHIKVKSSNKFADIEADNYQVNSVLNPETGYINFLGLLKSFEFKLGALDRVYNSKLVEVLHKPKFKYIGEIKNIKAINFNKAGVYNFEVTGTLFLWDEKRVTPGTGTITVSEDGTIEAFSDISFMIEKASVEKANGLIRRYMPPGVKVDAEKLGIDRKVSTTIKVRYQKKRSATRRASDSEK